MIPEAAVEAAAKVLLRTSVNRSVEPRGKALALCMAEVRPILEAAAPHMLKAAYDLGFEHGSKEPANPYRPTP